METINNSQESGRVLISSLCFQHFLQEKKYMEGGKREQEMWLSARILVQHVKNLALSPQHLRKRERKKDKEKQERRRWGNVYPGRNKTFILMSLIKFFFLELILNVVKIWVLSMYSHISVINSSQDLLAAHYSTVQIGFHNFFWHSSNADLAWHTHEI